MSTANSTKVIIMAFLANLGIAFAKLVGALISGSAALLAESVHSAVDSTNQLLLLFGKKASARAPSNSHPLGYGREAFFWSFVVAIILFTLGGVFSIYEGAHKISSGEAVANPWVGLIILGVSIVLEFVSFRAALTEVKAHNPYGSLWSWFKKTTAVELLVVFTEDLAAMCGLLIASASLFLSWFTGNAMWDGLGSILVGSLLVIVAVLLALEIKSLLIGEAPATDYREAITAMIADKIPNSKLLNLIALQTGSSEVMLSCKITPGNVTDVTQLINSINDVERTVKSRFPEVKWQFFEPDDAD